MPSISSRATKRAPQQERSEKRIAALLTVAGEVFAEVGYEAATMTEVAARSGSSIGALYNYFPDKQALAFALLNGYTQEMTGVLEKLLVRVPEMNVAALAEELLEILLTFAESRPGFLPLLAAPVRFRRDPGARKALRVAMGEAFRAKNPGLSAERAFLVANVTMQMVRGMMTVYGEVAVKDKPAVVVEFKRALSLYLGSVLRAS